MKKFKLRIWLTVLAALSLISGISINSKWAFLYQYTFIEGPKMLYRNIQYHELSWISLIHWIILLVSHVAILLLPFLSYKMINLKKWVLYFPLIFILAEIAVLSIISVILIPFALVWLGLLFYLKRNIEVS